MPQETATGRRRGRMALTWVLANAVLGYLATFPLLMVVVFGYFVRAELWGTVSSPFRAGEADVAVLTILVTGIPVAVAAVLVNRALRRRLDLRGWATLGFWVLTAAVLLAPFAVSALSGTTVNQLLGKGLFW